MTLPHVGNTGVNAEDVESDRPQVTAFIVREVSPVVSNWRANETLPDYLARHGIPGISEVDTRALTRACCVTKVCSRRRFPPTAAARWRSCWRWRARWEGLDGRDLVSEVTCQETYHWLDDTGAAWTPVPAGATRCAAVSQVRLAEATAAAEPGQAPHVVAYDFGIKHNILRRLASHGLRVTVVPAHTSAEEVLALAARWHLSEQWAGRSGGRTVCGAGGGSAAGQQESQSLAFAWGTRSSGWRWGRRPTSSSLAITAATSR